MTDSTLILSTPEAETAGPVGPGQQGILDEFIAEQQAAQQEEETGKILGKFNSQEDLAKAYQALEKKLGQQGADPGDASPDPSESPAAGYSAEQAPRLYGQEDFDALAEKGLDRADEMFKADSGQDISDHYDTLAETFGVPRQVVENYVSKAQVQATPPAPQGQLTDADTAELKAMIGGDDAFTKLSQWAAGNLDPKELADYNAIVDSGNKAAIRWALKAMQGRSTTATPAEPRLIGSGRPASEGESFESRQQVVEAMSKRNAKGQKLYDVDDAYRQKVRDLLARSDVF